MPDAAVLWAKLKYNVGKMAAYVGIITMYIIGKHMTCQNMHY